MVCKYSNCGYEGNDFRRMPVGPHIGIYCPNCDRWQAWEKHTANPKIKEEYRDEYLDKVPATKEQVYYIKNLLRDANLSKHQASVIIQALGGEHGG